MKGTNQFNQNKSCSYCDLKVLLIRVGCIALLARGRGIRGVIYENSVFIVIFYILVPW